MWTSFVPHAGPSRPSPAPPPPGVPSWVEAFERLFGYDPLRCPACKAGVLVATRVLPPMRA